MQVILLKNIPSLGNRGDIKDVTPGYARNYLIPQGWAEVVTEARVAALAKTNQQQAKRAVKDLVATEQLADKLNGRLIEISAKANEDGKLYAAVSPAAIVKILKNQGFNIHKTQIVLPAPIKELGEVPVTISLDHGLEAEITLNVHD